MFVVKFNRVAMMFLCVLLLLTAAVGLGSDVRKPKFPVKLDKPDFLAGIWDVGACYISGQPSESAFKKLAEEGIKTVICLRGTAEMNDRTVVSFDEAALLKDLKINYIHIPVGTDAEYSPEAIAKFAKALDQAQGKVLLHCTVAWRASYVWGTYLHRYHNTSLDDAIKVGEAMNMTANRVAMLLGTEMTYSEVEKKDRKAGKIQKPADGNKLNLKSPEASIAPNKDDFMAFVLWDMGDVLNSSQPNEAQLRDLAGKGVTTILNIRTPDEMARVKKESGYDEEAVAKSLGLTYVNVPIQALDSFTPKNLDLVHKALQASKGRTLLHCTTATRTSSLWIAYLVKYYGVSLDEAMKQGEAMRFSNIMTTFLGKDIVYKLKPKPGNRSCDGDGQ